MGIRLAAGRLELGRESGRWGGLDAAQVWMEAELCTRSLINILIFRFVQFIEQIILKLDNFTTCSFCKLQFINCARMGAKVQQRSRTVILPQRPEQKTIIGLRERRLIVCLRTVAK